MKASTACLSCLKNQAYRSAKIAHFNKAQLGKLESELDHLLRQSFPLHPSPFYGWKIQQIIQKIAQNNDPFAEIKKANTNHALSLYPWLKEQVKNAVDPLLTAMLVAIAGNIIDFAVEEEFSIETDIKNILIQKPAINHIPQFKTMLAKTEEIIYLGDNAGETVFDRILIETLGKPVLFIVRDQPVINDATLADASLAGLDQITTLLSSGCPSPGIIPDLCFPAFVDRLKKASLIISKGQGNYETLADENLPIFFLLKVKCEVVAQHLGVAKGALIIKCAD